MKLLCPYCKKQIEKADAWPTPKGPACEECAREWNPQLKGGKQCPKE